MAINDIENSAPPITESDLERAEASIGAKLPAAYRQFLLKHNGGRPQPRAFPFGDEPGSLLSTFYAVGDPDPTCDIVRAYSSRRREIPHDLLVVGVDAGGSYVCLGIRGERYGKVYFWSLEDAPDPPDPTSYENVWLVADSFEDFLQSFREPAIDA